MVGGYPDGNFKPAEFINFAEASKVVDESLDVEPDTTGTNNEWFAGYVKGLENKKAIPTTVQFFDKEITRGEMSEVVFRLKEGRTDKVTATYDELTNEFPTIASCPALLEKFEEYQSRNYYPVRFDDVVMMEADFAEESAAPMAAQGATADSANSSKSVSADDFSQTNVQVEGVDEADIIKNDGEHIYLAKGDSVRIVKAFPPAVMQEVAEIDFSDSSFYPSQLYVTDDELVVIGSSNHYYYHTKPLIEPAIDMIWPPAYGNDQTVVHVYDISDRAKPKKIRKVTYDGNYQSSRRIGNQLYLILNVHPNVWAYDRIEEGKDILPTLADGDAKAELMVECNDIRYFPGHARPQYMITTSFEIDNEDSKIHRNVFLGSSDNVYSSLDNLYVASTVVDYDRYTDWDWNRDQTKTHVFKFGLEDGEINFKNRGEVPGRILNQFSMDEHANHFRIATTTGNQWNEEDPSRNNVYVLDSNMDRVGSLEGLAKGESIFSTRFIGDRLYMVTFERVDPLFVISLSNPSNPVVLGELKIPGFSEYLHPYDENHIIGFGQEAVENQFGGIVTDGFKMSLFDVSDVRNPKQKFVEQIGDRGTYSELLDNHKALLFDKSKDLLAFPITIQEKVSYDELQCGKFLYDSCPVNCQKRCIPSECHLENGVSVCTDDCSGLGSCTTPEWDRYEQTFTGAVVYDINLSEGFKERGRITHYNPADFEKVLDYFPYDWEKSIQRIIYMGDYLYTIAQGGIKASAMDTVKEAKFIELQ